MVVMMIIIITLYGLGVTSRISCWQEKKVCTRRRYLPHNALKSHRMVFESGDDIRLLSISIKSRDLCPGEGIIPESDLSCSFE